MTGEGIEAVGDRLIVSPGGVAARVRRLHVDASDVARVHGGKDCLTQLATLAGDRADDVLPGLLEAPGGVDLDRFDLMFNLAPQAAKAIRDAQAGAQAGS